MLPAALLPLIGKGIMYGGTALGGVMAADGISKMPGNRADEIALQGPNARGQYDLNPLESLFINRDSLDDRRNKLMMDSTKKDADVRNALSLDSSLQILNGETPTDFLTRNSKQIRKAGRQEELTGAAEVQAALYNSPQQVEERRRRDQLRTDELAERTATRQDNNANRQTTLQLGQISARTAQGNQALQREMNMLQNNTTLQMAQMDSELADKRMAFDRETRSMDKRDRAIAQLMSGIGQLGRAFAL